MCNLKKNSDLENYTCEASKIGQKRSEPWPISRHFDPQRQPQHQQFQPFCRCKPLGDRPNNHFRKFPWLQHPCGSRTHHRQQQHVRLHNAMSISLQLGLFRHSLWPASCQKPDQFVQFVSDASGMREVASGLMTMCNVAAYCHQRQ